VITEGAGNPPWAGVFLKVKMIGNPATDETLDHGTLSASQAEAVDRACDRFEAAWRNGERPRIEAHLRDVPDSLRADLLRELITVDLERRRRQNEQPAFDDYARRFPGHMAVIAAAFSRTTMTGDETSSPDHLATATALSDGAGTSAPNEIGDHTSRGGRFVVLRPHARGGLGEVFVARDTELNREVALKEIQPRYADDPRHRARFEFEAEITGGLEHPGIVPVYGLGRDPAGRPFYAMRFIRGDSLKEAIDRFHAAEKQPGRDASQSTLELRELLGRFIDVCDAIAYAHSRGVLHRDLKPSNIMLGRYGETLVVDWGLAKSVDRDDEPQAPVEERPLRPSSGSRLNPTVAGAALGTPAYMSPEQASGQHDLVGPQSDVYCLGATLYHLLAGRAPCEAGALAEVLRKIGAGEVAKPRALNARIAPALEAVCLKAIGLRPEDRYESAEHLKSDVERWLADEPVTAWREPFAVRARRWMRRHRTMVSTAAAVLVFGSIALFGFTTMLAGKNRELDAKTRQALDQRDRALKAEKLARAEEAHARESEAESRAVLAFFQDHVLAATRPEGQDGGLGREVTIRKAIDAAEPAIAEAFRDKPAIEAAVRYSIGRTYACLDERALSIPQFERSRKLREQALGPEHPDTLRSLAELAMEYIYSGRTNDGVPLLEQVLALRQKTVGPTDPDTLYTMNALALAYDDIGRSADALALFEKTYQLRKETLGLDNDGTIFSMNNLGVAYADAGRPADALPLLEEAFQRRKARFGADHPDTIVSMRDLGSAYADLGRFDEAVRILEPAVRLARSKMGAEHVTTLMTMTILASAYRGTGRLNDAIPLCETIYETRKARLGIDTHATLIAMSNLALAYDAVGRDAEAMPLYELALERSKIKLGVDHPQTLTVMCNLASALTTLGQVDRAIPIYEAALETMKTRYGPHDVNILRTSKGLAQAYLRSRPERAEALLRDLLAFYQQSSPDDWHTFEIRTLLGAALLAQKRYAAAEPLLIDGYKGLEFRKASIPVPKHQINPEAHERIVALYQAWDKRNEAEAWKNQPPSVAPTAPKLPAGPR
jgi:tetratricopeptide (TPR) repeat protein